MFLDIVIPMINSKIKVPFTLFENESITDINYPDLLALDLG